MNKVKIESLEVVKRVKIARMERARMIRDDESSDAMTRSMASVTHDVTYAEIEMIEKMQEEFNI